MKLQKLFISYGFLICLLSMSTIVGCAINPVTNRPDFVLTTTEGERQIGAGPSGQRREGFFAEKTAAI